MRNMNALTRGIIILVILAIITVVEFVVGTRTAAPVVLMVIFALLKAALVVWFFMHVLRVFKPGDQEGGH